MRSCVLSVCALSACTSGVFASNGQFTAENGRITDPSGNDFVPVGVNVPGVQYWTVHDPTPDVSLIADSWKFNTVRVACMTQVGWNMPGYKNNLDAIINAFTARHIVTVIEAHDQTGWYFEDIPSLGITSLTQVSNWFGDLAAKYKNNPYVWFNTANEPGTMPKPADGDPALATWDMWTPDGPRYLAMNRSISAAIRATGNTNPIVIDGTYGGQDQAWDDTNHLNPKHSAILTYGPTLQSEFSNTVFDFHVYGEWDSPGAISQRLPLYLDAAKQANLSLMVGEWGTNNQQWWWQSRVDFLKTAEQYGLGRLAWAWSDENPNGIWLTSGDDPNAIGMPGEFGGGYLINDPNSPTNLTPFGQLAWDDSHLAASSTPEPTGVATLTIAGTVATMARRRRRA